MNADIPVSAAAQWEGGAIDCDMHPTVVGGIDAVAPYLSTNQRARLEFLGVGGGYPPGIYIPGRFQHFLGNVVRRPDAIPPNGGPAGSDVQFAREHLLDRCGIDAAILLSVDCGTRIESWTYPDEAAWYVSALNDLLRHTWLEADSRFHLAITVSPLDPALAAKEIVRHGDAPGVVAVHLPMLNIPFGQRYYHPIYAAAAELGLPIMAHPGASYDFVGCAQFAGGMPTTQTERSCLFSQLAQANLNSMIFEGVFELFPQLKMVFAEYGWTWVASHMWRMDTLWKSARRAHPWVKKFPTEYVRERVRFTTQPALECPNPTYLRQTIEMMFGSETLLFSTDYPHWDSDEPTAVLKGLESSVRQRIMRDSAIDFFGSRLRLPGRVGVDSAEVKHASTLSTQGGR
jgi:predicted TIM-barrel fold metal-dependent hydrolase